jgi:hypothetical protein
MCLRGRPLGQNRLVRSVPVMQRHADRDKHHVRPEIGCRCRHLKRRRPSPPTELDARREGRHPSTVRRDSDAIPLVRQTGIPRLRTWSRFDVAPPPSQGERSPHDLDRRILRAAAFAAWQPSANHLATHRPRLAIVLAMALGCSSGSARDLMGLDLGFAEHPGGSLTPDGHRHGGGDGRMDALLPLVWAEAMYRWHCGARPHPLRAASEVTHLTYCVRAQCRRRLPGGTVARGSTRGISDEVMTSADVRSLNVVVRLRPPHGTHRCGI